MRNKKGFTLIELLAVIVILAIIALIATPMIMGVIDKAKKGSAEASALGYIEGIENYGIIGMLDNNGEAGLASGIYAYNDAALDSIEFKGEKPVDGWVAVNNKGLVVAASLKFKIYNNHHVGYTIADRAKATLSSSGVAKPTLSETVTLDDVVTSVHDALNPAA